jgi:hypothetical protein
MADEARHEAVLRRWEREIERQRARAGASEENFKKTFADLMRQENIKRSIAMDAQNATRDPSRHAQTRDVEALKDNFINRGYISDEVISGLEPLPWEND